MANLLFKITFLLYFFFVFFSLNPLQTHYYIETDTTDQCKIQNYNSIIHNQINREKNCLAYIFSDCQDYIHIIHNTYDNIRTLICITHD